MTYPICEPIEPARPLSKRACTLGGSFSYLLSQLSLLAMGGRSAKPPATFQQLIMRLVSEGNSTADRHWVAAYREFSGLLICSGAGSNSGRWLGEES